MESVTANQLISDLIKSYVRDIPDFPKKGIVFKDITPVLKEESVRKSIVENFVERVNALEIDAVVGIESRGFLFGVPIADKLKVPFIPIRKVGKLPFETVKQEYDLEYGTAEVEIHIDAIKKGWKVMVHDDLLATGGTAMAAAELVKKLGGSVEAFSFVIELAFLNGKEKIKDYCPNIISLVNY